MLGTPLDETQTETIQVTPEQHDLRNHKTSWIVGKALKPACFLVPEVDKGPLPANTCMPKVFW